MDRRLFLLSTLSLAACDPGSGRQTVICDRSLGPPLTRAREAYGKVGVLVLNEADAAELLDRAEHEPAAVVVTRRGLLANRLQRLGYVRLEHRWQTEIAGERVEIMVTKGGPLAQPRALAFAKWLAGPEATPYLATPTAP